MSLTIITINRNNAAGLEKTMRSVAAQTYKEFEYIVIDGVSTDRSVEVIKYFESQFVHFKWISEPDTGIYNAMNKGIQMASGLYLEFLNSGDCLVGEDVVERMLIALENNDNPTILYGNMLKEMPDGTLMRNKGSAGQEITLMGMFTGTLNHSPTYIKRSLFNDYGLYDENLKIVSDWKWFTQVIVLHGEKPVYVDIDVTRFDMTGISETNKELNKSERKKVLDEMLPKAILADYEQYAFPVEQIERLKRHPWAYKMVWFLERCLFKIEKHEAKRHNTLRR